MDELLRDRQGRWLGWIVTQGNRRIVKDRYNHILGWYDPQDGWTKNSEGRLVGQGDMLVALLMEAVAKEADKQRR